MQFIHQLAHNQMFSLTEIQTALLDMKQILAQFGLVSFEAEIVFKLWMI